MLSSSAQDKKTESGIIKKMVSEHIENQIIQYYLPINNKLVPLNNLINKNIKLHFNNEILCINCHKKTKKSFSQGFCFSCFRKLACCDMCIMKPELCHYHNGTCREPKWGESFCMTDHIVYLSNTSDLKIGITRASQIPTRWIDQGATQALPIFRVSTRQLSGFVEDLFRKKINDRTNWRTMLKGENISLDLYAIRDNLLHYFEDDIKELQNTHGLQAIQALNNAVITQLQYPVHAYPEKINSFNFDKTPDVTGILQGIKGQYFILDNGVINIRKFTGYNVSLGIM